jgi:hypothetical protein
MLSQLTETWCLPPIYLALNLTLSVWQIKGLPILVSTVVGEWNQSQRQQKCLVFLSCLLLQKHLNLSLIAIFLVPWICQFEYDIHLFQFHEYSSLNMMPTYSCSMNIQVWKWCPPTSFINIQIRIWWSPSLIQCIFKFKYDAHLFLFYEY